MGFSFKEEEKRHGELIMGGEDNTSRASGGALPPRGGSELPPVSI